MTPLTKSFRKLFLILVGAALALVSTALSLNTPFTQSTTPTPLPVTIIPIAKSDQISKAGSTDVIVLLAVIIMLTVIIPILLRRMRWMRR